MQASYDTNPADRLSPPKPRHEEPTGWDRFSAENLKKSFKKAIGKGPSEPIAQERLSRGARAVCAPKDYKAAAKEFARGGRSLARLVARRKRHVHAGRKPVLRRSILQSLRRVRRADEEVRQHASTSTPACGGSLPSPITGSRAIRPIRAGRSRRTRRSHAALVRHARQWRSRRSTTCGSTTRAAPWPTTRSWPTANAFFVRGRWSDADYYYTLLRNDYPKSEFQVQAHLLGLAMKLKLYQGPDYDGKALLEADELIDQMLVPVSARAGRRARAICDGEGRSAGPARLSRVACRPVL